jgi:hypothetical protein
VGRAAAITVGVDLFVEAHALSKIAAMAIVQAQGFIESPQTPPKISAT